MHQKSTEELFTTFLSEHKAEALFTNFHGLRNIARASQEEFMAIGLDKKDIKQVKAVLELGRKYIKHTPRVKRIDIAKDSYTLRAPMMQRLDQEVVRCILPDERHYVLDTPLVTIGTLNSCLLDPREVFKEAIRQNAYALILAHQHPSGDPSPSVPDITATERIKNAGDILGIRVLDHVIIGAEGRYFSFYENNQL